MEHYPNKPIKEMSNAEYSEVIAKSDRYYQLKEVKHTLDKLPEEYKGKTLKETLTLLETNIKELEKWFRE